MLTETQVRQQEAREDLIICNRVIRMAQWILDTAKNPLTKQWAQEELTYWSLRAESDQGIIDRP